MQKIEFLRFTFPCIFSLRIGYMYTISGKQFECPVNLTLHTIMGKWKALILWQLNSKKKRYGELRKALPTITHKMLTQQLRELEADGIISRTVYPVVPPKVEYALTEQGKEIGSILDMMAEWAQKYRDPEIEEENTELVVEEEIEA